MKIENIYRIIRDAVKHYQAEGCKRPNTFAVLNSPDNLNADNLGKTICDAYRPFFFSRQWEAKRYNPSDLSFTYPIVTVYEGQQEVTDLFTNKQTICYTIDLAVLDQYDQNCTKHCQGDKGRTPNEIYQDTEDILFEILGYLKNVKIVVDGTILHNNQEGEIDERKTGNYLNMIKSQNKRSNSYRFQGRSNANLYGNVISLKFCFDRCHDTDTVFNFYEDKGKINDINCCG